MQTILSGFARALVEQKQQFPQEGEKRTVQLYHGSMLKPKEYVYCKNDLVLPR